MNLKISHWWCWWCSILAMIPAVAEEEEDWRNS